MRYFVLIAVAILAGCYDGDQARWIARENLCEQRGLGWHYMTREFMAGSISHWYCVRVDSVILPEDRVELRIR